MLKRRIVYTIWWIILILYLVFSADVISVGLIIFTLLLTVLTALTAYKASKNTEIDLSCDSSLRAGSSNTIELKIANGSKLPVFNASAVLKCTNEALTDTQSLNCSFYLGTKEKSSIEIDLKCDYEGKLFLAVTEVLFMDIFGVISFKRDYDRKIELLVEAANQEDKIDEQSVSGSEETKNKLQEEVSPE